MTHLLTLAATSGCLGFRFLAVMFAETDIHIALNLLVMCENIAYHTILDGPTEEVELPDGGLLNRRLTGNLETDTLTAAERIKHPLTVSLELAFVVEVYEELSVIQEVADIELLGIICDEPVDEAETNGRLTC